MKTTLNRLSGYVLFAQVAYLAGFIAVTVIDISTNHSIFRAFRSVRSSAGLDQSFGRVSDYLYYPIVFTAPLNVFLLAAFLFHILRSRRELDLSEDFFSILNAIYVVSSGWILFTVFANHLKQ